MFFERVILASSFWYRSNRPSCFIRFSTVERLKARVNELSAGRKAVKEDTIRYEDLVKQLKLDYKVNKKRSIDSLGFYLKHLDDFFKGFKAVEIRSPSLNFYTSPG